MIASDWTILSFAAKWLGSKKVIQMDTSKQENVRDDRLLLSALWAILDNADIVVGQNIKAFDIRRINARMLMHGFGPYSPVKVIDTKVEAKKYFDFTSNRLEWLSKHLTDTPKSAHKKFPGFSLWEGCLRGDKAAWTEMRKYNIRDVVSDEKLYLRLRPWIDNHPNMGNYTTAEKIVCPKCGSEDLRPNGNAYTQTGKYQRYRCLDCGGFARSRYSENAKTKAKVILV